jgi:hypothetical protein
VGSNHHDIANTMLSPQCRAHLLTLAAMRPQNVFLCSQPWSRNTLELHLGGLDQQPDAVFDAAAAALTAALGALWVARTAATTR